jgi:hypothetical protein
LRHLCCGHPSMFVPAFPLLRLHEADPRDVQPYGSPQDGMIKMFGGELHTALTI